MNSKLFIADKIKVGFNLRNDTYTGKLGYVIGHDGKKWRKEPSWEGWRVKHSSPDEIERLKKQMYDNTIATQTNYYASNKQYHEKNPSDSYYAKYAKMTLEDYLKQTVGTYEKFKPHIGNISDDPSIIPVEYDNVPTEGFVLNKKAGGYSNGWNHRSTYCRVYDPRGFEF